MKEFKPEIEYFIWGNDETAQLIRPEKNQKFVYNVENFGDHGVGWIRRINSQNKEIAKYNVRYISEIKWMEPYRKAE